MLAAVAEAARVLDTLPSPEQQAVRLHSEYYKLATRNAEFLLANLRPDGKLRRSWRDGKVTGEVFLEDYAALILGLLELYQTDFNNKWFAAAKELADEMTSRFSDPAGGFFDTPNDGEALLIRPKDIQDNATPCGNSLACEALLKLAEFTGEGTYRDLAETSLTLVTGFVLRYPLGFSKWLQAAEGAVRSVKQVALLGEAGEPNFERMIQAVRAEYRPGVVVAASSHPIKGNAPALLRDRNLLNEKATAYVCEGFVCKQPVTDVDALSKLLNS
jgi:uncharacterized protein